MSSEDWALRQLYPAYDAYCAEDEEKDDTDDLTL